MIAGLPPDATVRVFSAEPALAPAAATALVAAVERLLAQFVREGRCSAAGAEVAQDGRFVVVAWDGPALSGCSHDKLGQVVALHERQASVELLAAPPIAVGHPVQVVDRPRLRALLASGALDATAPWWDVRVVTLGAWRAQPATLAESPWAALAGAADTSARNAS